MHPRYPFFTLAFVILVAAPGLADTTEGTCASLSPAPAEAALGGATEAYFDASSKVCAFRGERGLVTYSRSAYGSPSAARSTFDESLRFAEERGQSKLARAAERGRPAPFRAPAVVEVDSWGDAAFFAKHNQAFVILQGDTVTTIRARLETEDPLVVAKSLAEAWLEPAAH